MSQDPSQEDNLKFEALKIKKLIIAEKEITAKSGKAKISAFRNEKDSKSRYNIYRLYVFDRKNVK